MDDPPPPVITTIHWRTIIIGFSGAAVFGSLALYMASVNKPSMVVLTLLLFLIFMGYATIELISPTGNQPDT